MPLASTPLFLRSKGITEEACRQVNRQGSLQRDGVLRQAYSALAIQCYAPAPDTFKVAFQLAGFAPALAGLREGDVALPEATPPTSLNDPAWYRAPSEPRVGLAEPPPAASTPEKDSEQGLQNYSVRQTTLSFGSVSVGEQATLAITVTNTGSLSFTTGVSVSVDGVGFGLAGSGQAFDSGESRGQCAGLPSGASCDVLITWSPAYTSPDGLSWTAKARVQGTDAGTCPREEGSCVVPGVDVLLEGYANPSGLALPEQEQVEEASPPAETAAAETAAAQEAAPQAEAPTEPPAPFSVTYVGPAATEQEVDPLAFAGKHAAACETLMDTNNTKANECQAEFFQATLSGKHPTVVCLIEKNKALGGNSRQIRCSE